MTSNKQSDQWTEKANESNSDDLYTIQRTIIGLVGLVMCFLTLFIFLQDLLPKPYMDEQFHVDQLHAYCAGNFSYWNNKLTTPPGLYLFTMGVFKPFKELYAFGRESPEEICPLYLVRFTNFLFGTANFFLVYLIQSNLNSKYMFVDKFKLLISSLATASLPPLFFFNFFYYTDPGSLFFVLLMYLFDLEDHTYLASLFGFLSLLFRQSNIVWVFFVAAKFSVNFIINLKQSNLSNKDLLLQSTISIMKRCAGYLLVAIAFIAFLIINNGIVLGDREAHKAVLHTGQMHYYLAFVCLFAWPHLLYELFRYLDRIDLKFLLKFLFIVLLLSCLSNYAHPYLLADNRHYTFYAWRRIFNSSYSFLFLPLYSLGLLLMYQKMNHLDNYSRNVFISFHLLCTLLTILPAYLLEFRYFIIPFIIWRLHLKIDNRWAFRFELLTNVMINLITFYVFIFKPFYWDSSTDLQRLMW